MRESKAHGWPSFRDQEVNWDYVRVLPNGECISVDGTHLGHNLPDGSGNRYCIKCAPPTAAAWRVEAVLLACCDCFPFCIGDEARLTVSALLVAASYRSQAGLLKALQKSEK